MPQRAEITAVAMPAGVPVIELPHTSLDQDSKLFEVTRFVVRADRSALDHQTTIGDT